MDLILSHHRTDFDAFASMLLAQKLFPQARPFLPGTVIYKLREFISLFRNTADFPDVSKLRKIKGLEIGTAVVVDTRKRHQVKDFAPFLNQAKRVVVFDHHPPTADDLDAYEVEIYSFGANTTGLARKLERDAGTLDLTPVEATIVLLGIYADTGNLTYPGTTAEDALVVARMLQMGADLQTVNEYLRPYFDPAQRFVFRDMLHSAREIDIEGYKIVLTLQRLAKPIQGLSILVAQAGDMLGADAILGVFGAEDREGVQLVLQSHMPEINVAELAHRFGGGGHPGAAAANIPQAGLEETAESLLAFMTEAPWPTTKVRDRMTLEVVTLPPDISLSECADRMNRRGVGGAPVVDDGGRMVGVISMRDVEEAGQKGLLHIPIKGFMKHKVITVQPEDPLVSARKIISSHNVGHLPVVSNGSLVGILSRSDVLRSNGRDARPVELRPVAAA